MVGRVLVVGSSNTDLVGVCERLPRPGETVRGRTFATYAGGKGANQAVAAARAGAQVTFAGAVGDDQYGRDRLADLRRDGIDVALTVTAPGATSGIALIAVDAAGENEIIMIPGANDLVTPALAGQAVADSAAEVLSLTLEIPLASVQAALAARPPSMRAVLNAASYDPGIIALAHLIDVLIVNEVEAGEWLGRPVSPETAGADARQLAGAGPELAVITLGSSGAYYADRAGRTFHQPALQVEVVDTTGAGDAFCGAFAAWLARGEEPAEAVRAGVAAGALAVSVAGAQPSLPSADRITALMPRLPSAERLS